MTEKKLSRQEIAAAKRRLVLSSKAFKTWWRWRQTFTPTPSDPYRAYMIDLGLYARVHHVEVWKHRTNRLDYPPVDYPRGRGRKPRLPSRKEIGWWKPVPAAAVQRPLTKYEQKLVAQVEAFEEKYHLPRAEVKFEPRETAHYRPAIFGIPTIMMPRELVALGEKPPKREKGFPARQEISAVLFHEAGHHAHAAYGGVGRISEKPVGLESVITSPYVLGGTLTEKQKKEEIAWAVAKKATPWTPFKAWVKRTYLGTYYGTTPSFTTVYEHLSLKRKGRR